MASTTGTTTTSVTMFTCPACQREVQAQVVLRLSSPDLAELEGAMTLQASPVGLHVSHDCTPRQKRLSSMGDQDPLPPLTGDSHG